MKHKKLIVKLFLSLSVNLISWLISVSVGVGFFECDPDFYIVLSAIIILTLVVLFFIYKIKRMETGKSNIIYWSFSGLCVSTHLWFYFIFVTGPFWTW